MIFQEGSWENDHFHLPKTHVRPVAILPTIWQREITGHVCVPEYVCVEIMMPSPAVVSVLLDHKRQSLANLQPEGTWQKAHGERRPPSLDQKEKRNRKKGRTNFGSQKTQGRKVQTVVAHKAADVHALVHNNHGPSSELQSVGRRAARQGTNSSWPQCAIQLTAELTSVIMAFSAQEPKTTRQVHFWLSNFFNLYIDTLELFHHIPHILNLFKTL